ncbi:uncharacterized protein N7473_002276 [Penicillium subrubescens]|uniref:uncharacterized protein n=1 Tax=Penicillium subrubescens TaxID=1316194 RepID=UPI0025459718|nr:uncharacterized protein N7473_002276 [Penicillium subrubescens]KAJ5905360.1 hypothetical protein N7473_002276 [Penicillium subrubescens]
MRTSHQNRLVANGVPISEFSQQYRCHPDIALESPFAFEENHMARHRTAHDTVRARFIRGSGTTILEV